MNIRLNKSIVSAFLDNGSSRTTITPAFAKKHAIPIKRLRKPITLEYANKEVEEVGHITNLVLTCFSVPLHLPALVRASASHDLTLGLDWLQWENPDIDWARATISERASDHRTVEPAIPERGPLEAKSAETPGIPDWLADIADVFDTAVERPRHPTHG